MRKIAAVFAFALVVSAAPALAGEPDWRRDLLGKWSGIPRGTFDSSPRVLTVTAIRDDGRVEGSFWGPTLGSQSLPLSPESKATFDGRYVSLNLQTTGGGGFDVALELSYDTRRRVLTGDYIIPSAGRRFSTYFDRE